MADGVLCSHGNNPRTCPKSGHTEYRHCPRHEVGWSAEHETGCWYDPHCLAKPKLGDVPAPRFNTDTSSAVHTTREEREHAAAALNDHLDELEAAS